MQIISLVRERRQYRREDERVRAWDEAQGIRHPGGDPS